MSRTEKPRVLIVDDNEATLTLLTALLQREFSVQKALDGREAIERFRMEEYSVVLLDLRMPEIDGFGVLEHLRTERPDLLPRVIVVTAVLTRADMARVYNFGVHALVAKPFEIDGLHAKVKECAGLTSPGSGFLTSGVMLMLAELIRDRLL